MKWILKLWHRRLRNVDIRILWPECKRLALDMDHAKAAFAVHAFNDHAWANLTEEEVIATIEGLR